MGEAVNEASVRGGIRGDNDTFGVGFGMGDLGYLANHVFGLSVAVTLSVSSFRDP